MANEKQWCKCADNPLVVHDEAKHTVVCERGCKPSKDAVSCHVKDGMAFEYEPCKSCFSRESYK